MRVLPMLFSPAMARANLDDLKTQTRRPVVPQPFASGYFEGDVFLDVIPADSRGPLAYRFSASAVGGGAALTEVFEPRIQVGDLVYAREPWRVGKKWDGASPANSHKGRAVIPERGVTVLFVAGGSIANHDDGWRPDPWPPAGELPEWAGKVRQAMHMPRWASRFTLEVVAVRVERLQSISPADARSEGIQSSSLSPGGHWFFAGDKLKREFFSGRDAYRGLWNDINGKKLPWDLNPWVVAYTYRVHKMNVDKLLEERANG